MSFQSRNNNNRREGSRIPVNNSSRTNQEWVPRGGGGGGWGSTGILETPPPPSPSPSPPTVNPNVILETPPLPPAVNQNLSLRNGGDSSSKYVAPFKNRVRGNFGNQKGWVPSPVNSRKEKDGKSQVGKDLDTNSNSNLPPLVQEIQEKLVKGTVECMICYEMVRRTAPMWSCSSCYSIFHLSCIKRWARAPTSVDLSVEKDHGLNWRCPGCQSVQLLTPKEIRYICFCGKRPDPPPDSYLTPHSCGESCGKPLEKQIDGGFNGDDGDQCPHRCVLQCHAGPCPPCKAFAPARSCPCGTKMITTRCSDRKSDLTCGQICNKVLDCGRHYCKKICHTGPCETCEVPMNAACFCKKKTEVLLCGEVAVKGELVEEAGLFSCDSICAKTLVCGNHTCGESCHPGSCGECELMPRKIKSCYCGKTTLQKERKSCLDPIPTCSNTCGKTLPCQIHRCKDICHIGDCSPCLVIVKQMCRCGSSSQAVECYKTMEEKDKFCCEKPCGRKKNCGRHRCSERCCPLSNSNDRSSGDGNPHLCSMNCGKKLRCGQHSCEFFCHSGHCAPCFQTIFTDLTCTCGKTSIPPPQPCGTPPPSCQHPCSVPQPCGHSSSHGCHFGDCPPCSVPVAKECIGGHVVLRNIPCASKEVRCNQLCGKNRQCGMHACGRTCHPPPCDSSCGSVSGSKFSCGQICGAPRGDCRHTCNAPCHPGAPCPDLRCDFPVTITCSCGRITATVPCGSGGSSGGYTVFEASITQKLAVPLLPVKANGKKIPPGQRKLVCDDECVKMERRRVLADAFNITTKLDALHYGEDSSVPDQLVDLCRRDPNWVSSVEERCKFLVLGKSRGNANSLNVHAFCPMLKEKRDAVTYIAERWKLSVHAAGWEPKKFLVVHATPKSKAPARMLCLKGSSLPFSASNALAFDPLVDMDQRLVVALLDLPRDADISALVLRFGGECELVWLNDRNALAVFSDAARASTALRRLDHGSAYQGAVVVQNTASLGRNAWVGGAGIAKEGGTVGALQTNVWKKAVAQEPRWGEDSWGIDHGWSGSSADTLSSVWKGKEGLFATNQYNVLDQVNISNSTSASSGGLENPSNHKIGSCSSSTGPKSSNLEIKSGGDDGIHKKKEVRVVDHWEEAYE